MIILCFSVTAIDIKYNQTNETETHSATSGLAIGGDSNMGGFVIKPNYDVLLFNISMASIITPQMCEIHNGTLTSTRYDTLLTWQNTTPYDVGDTTLLINFTDGFFLRSGVNYTIICGSNLSSYNRKNWDAITYPTNRTNIQYMQARQWVVGTGWVNYSNNGFNIENITTERYQHLSTTENYTENLLNEINTTYSIRINDTAGLSPTVYLEYNGTLNLTAYLKTNTSTYRDYEILYMPNESFADSTNITSKWWINSSQTGMHNTTPFNQSLYNINVTDCGQGLNSVETINYTIRDENDGGLVSANSGTLLTVTQDDYTRNFAYNYSNRYSFKYCIYPYFGNYTTAITISLNKDNYSSREYNFEEVVLNNVTQYETLYMLKTINVTLIDVTLVDEYDETISGYYVYAYRYNVGNNSFTLVQSEISDVDGMVEFSLDIESDQYKFEVYNPSGRLVYTRTRSKLIETSYTFRITLGTVTEHTIPDLEDLVYELSLNRGTRNWTLTWSEATDLIYNITLEVTKQNTTGAFQYYNQTSTVGGGTLTYTLNSSNAINGTYVGSVYVYSKGDGQKYYIDGKDLVIKEEWDVFGTETLIMALLFVGTLTLIGISFSAESGLLALAFGMFLFVVLGFIKLGAGALVGLVAVIIIIIFYIHKKVS